MGKKVYLRDFLGACTKVMSSANGHDRGDGYDIEIWLMPGGERYLVTAWKVGSKHTELYVAPDLGAARAVGEAGYTPGSAPGAYEYCARWRALKEVRTWKMKSR